jgi:dolichyl-phosphate beta-glucosyltransferase
LRMRDVRVVIVVPCFDEERRLDLEAFRAFIASAEGADVRFLFVDDGSRDGTLALLRSFEAEAPARVAVLALAKNGGKAEAVRRGIVDVLARSDADAVGFWDADLATPLSELSQFTAVLATRSEIDSVFGSRVRLLGRQISRRARRHYVGRVGATLISSTLGLAVYDTQCGAKLFRVTKTAPLLFDRPFISRWIFDVEIIARLIEVVGRDRAAQSIYELPLRVWRDVHGSKVSGRDFFRSLNDLWKIHRTYRPR